MTQTTGTYATADASRRNLVTVTLAAGDFAAVGATNLANYVLPTTVTGFGAIDRAVLTAAIVGQPTKPFDGTTTATLTSANFSLVGLCPGAGCNGHPNRRHLCHRQCRGGEHRHGRSSGVATLPPMPGRTLPTISCRRGPLAAG